ncbi:MAG TPA: TNT domain-containing protein [Actinophytocola sp.]|nr:TNT domain-containing protein [Actinophytocola sp.]
MGIELPPELADVAAQAGVAWPEADEEEMARSAQAWREAAEGMSTLTTDADTTVRGALDAVEGDTGTAATQHWSTFVEPDSGHLTSTVRGMNDAADRLTHAADQVGTAKVEIVRNLVSLAQNTDAAHTAAAAGHPMALAGLDTAVRGTSANVANIESNLVSAVQPASGVDMAAVQPPVNANPGTHGPGLLATVTDPATNLVSETVHATTDTVTDTVADTGRGPADLVGGGPGGHGGPGERGGLVPNLVTDTVRATTDLVTDTGHGATDIVSETGRGATNLVGGGPGEHGGPGLVPGAVRDTTELVADTGRGAADVVGGGPVADVARGTADIVDNTGQGAADLVGEPGRGVADGAPGLVGPHPGDNLPGPGDPEITGPIPIGPPAVDNPWSPGDGQHVLPDDLPTPPTGVTSQAGFAGVDVAPAAANLPPAPPPVGGVPAPGAGGAPAYGGGPAFGGPPGPVPGQFGGAPAGPGPAAPGPGVGAAPGGVAGPGPTANPGAGAAAGARPGAGARPMDGAPVRPADAPLPEPRRYGQPMPTAPSAPPVKERDEVLALFWVHMFPIGHIPVAADRPARQLPPPPVELDYAAGMRFAPGDHPRADLVDSVQRRAALRDGVTPADPTEPLPADSAEVAAIADGHDPLGGENERDWDRRYLVRFGSVTPQGISREGVEFAWPPGEQYPEGGSAPGEAEVLDEGTELDRFGRWEGRVFAEAGTPFGQRSLPPAHLEHGYRRYRVLAPLPVWRAVSAAWFGQTGGGIRYRTTHSAMELIALGYLADITREGT